MKRYLALVTIFTLALCLPSNMALAQEKPGGASLPENMPEQHAGFCSIDGQETNGVLFVLQEVHYEEHVLTLHVLQLPNDDYTSIMDNQTEDTADGQSLDEAVGLASPYGRKVIGTLCDIESITDAQGNNLVKEYKVSSERKGPSLVTVFEVYQLPENGEIDVELVFGVNEDLNYRFPRSGSLRFGIPY